MRILLLLGHSLVEYGDWGRLFPGHAVANLGVAGETTAGLLGRLDRVLAEHPRADAVALMSGANDLLAGNDGFVAESRVALKRLRRAYPRARLVLHAVLPVNPDWLAPETVAAVNRRLAAVAAEAGVAFLDLGRRFADDGGGLRPDLYEADGVHLSPAGYRLWAEALGELLGIV